MRRRMEAVMQRSLNVQLLIAAVLVAGLAGCTGTSQHSSASISVNPARALLDVPLTATVHGLPANAVVTVSTSTVAANGTAWTSSAEFRSNADGTVSLGQPTLEDSS